MVDRETGPSRPPAEKLAWATMSVRWKASEGETDRSFALAKWAPEPAIATESGATIGHDRTMTEVTLTAQNGRTLMLRRLTSPDDESI